MTPSLLHLLSRPPTFIPTPHSCNHAQVFSYVVDFLRRLQWRCVFADQKHRPYFHHFGIARSQAWPPPGRVPASIHRLSRRLLGVARSILEAPHSCHRHSNLADDELAALHSLRSDSQLVVRPADKGGRWVVMDTDAYATECSRQLQDQDFYRLLTSPLSEPHLDPAHSPRPHALRLHLQQ